MADLQTVMRVIDDRLEEIFSAVPHRHRRLIPIALLILAVERVRAAQARESAATIPQCVADPIAVRTARPIGCLSNGSAQATSQIVWSRRADDFNIIRIAATRPATDPGYIDIARLLPRGDQMTWKVTSALRYGLTVLALTGCASSEELHQRDETVCRSYGFQAGTPDFATCLQREELARPCGAGPILALHVKPHPEQLSCRNDPV